MQRAEAWQLSEHPGALTRIRGSIQGTHSGLDHPPAQRPQLLHRLRDVHGRKVPRQNPPDGVVHREERSGPSDPGAAMDDDRGRGGGERQPEVPQKATNDGCRGRDPMVGPVEVVVVGEDKRGTGGRLVQKRQGVKTKF